MRNYAFRQPLLLQPARRTSQSGRRVEKCWVAAFVPRKSTLVINSAERDDAAKGIFGDERPPSPGAGSAHDFYCCSAFATTRRARDEAKKEKNILETDLAL